MEEIKPAGQSLDEILNQAKEAAQAPESQPETEQPQKDEETLKEDDNQETESREDYKKNAASRIKELLDDRKRDRQELESLKAQAEEFKRFKEDYQTRKPAETETEAPNWFTKIWGYDPQVFEAYKIFKKGMSEDFEKTKSQAVQEALDNFKRQQQEDYNRQKAIENEIDELAKEEKFDKNELKTFLTKYPIIDQKEPSRYGYKAALDLMRELKTAKKSEKSIARKELLAVKNAPEEDSKKEFFTPRDFR